MTGTSAEGSCSMRLSSPHLTENKGDINMATNAAGIIFSNLHDANISELTNIRTMSSVPFGGRYRFIDFALSNMVHAGITDVNVITHNSYKSLMDHVGSGKDWDLARRSGGLRILPPYISPSSKGGTLYTTRLEALRSVLEVIANIKEDVIVLSDCDSICNIDLTDMLKQHAASGVPVTIAVKRMKLSEEKAAHETVVVSDDDGYVKEVVKAPTDIDGELDVEMNIVAIDKVFLYSSVREAESRGSTSLSADIMPSRIAKRLVKVYRYDGFYADVTSMADYYACSMSILEKGNRDALFAVKDRPILTKVRNSAPTKYVDGCKVTNSLIADGCVIEGEVENSVLFRGVKVGKGTVVKNSILFQDTLTGENVFLNCVIADKNTVITDNVMLSGHSSVPFYIEKGRKI